MKLSILTTITNPDKREDRWIEAIECYKDLADEVVVVNGGEPSTQDLRDSIAPKIKLVDVPWPDNWNWVEYPRHMNAGLKACTGDWILRLDIDQLIHEKNFAAVRNGLEKCPADCMVATFQKMSFVYNKKYFQKGAQGIAFRNAPNVVLGKDLDNRTDLCFPIRQTGVEVVYHSMMVDGNRVEGSTVLYELPIGKALQTFKTGVQYLNYDYFFKTQEVMREQFWRSSQAYYRYYHEWPFGGTEEEAFKVFLSMEKGRYERSPYTYTLDDHPKYVRKLVEELKPEQFGFNGWGLV